MSETPKRTIEGIEIEIDRDLCVGFGDCLDAAADVFELDDDGIAVFKEDIAPIEQDRLVEACRSCPVDALTALDAQGRHLAP